MKASHAFALVGLALFVGFLAARRSVAEPTRPSAAKEPAIDNGLALHQLESFVAYLQNTKQTNTLQRFYDYSNASMAQHNSADLGITLGTLQRLRDGRTNAAFELLEGKLDTDICGFVASYRELPHSLREKMSLKILQYARDYRAKFPFKNRYANGVDWVADAFKLLDEKAAEEP